MMRKLIALSLVIMMMGLGIAQANVPTGDSPQVFSAGHPACAGLSVENPSSAECSALIAARPTPNVSRVPVDFGIISEIPFIRFNKNEVAIYDAPNGTQVDTMTTGYMYVAPSEFQAGFAKLGNKRWVSLEDARLGSPSDFSGVLINEPLDMPFAWVLWGHDARKAPDGESDRENGRYERFQLVNIYATVNVRGWNWYLIGEGHWTNQQNLSLVYPSAPASFGGNWAGINLYEQNLVAYRGGTPQMATLVSSGVKNGLWDTNTGTFNIGTRVEAGTMNGAEGSPDFYSLDLVPYAQYFDQLISLHGTYWHDSFGYPHSHGCVNLSVSDANWLYSFLGEGATVYVYDEV